MSVFIKKYFDWIQKDVPKGDVEKYPELDGNGETSVKGIYIIGDLTGIPLLKLAADSGAKTVKFLDKNEAFQKERTANKDKNILDIIIVGAGPSGISAGLELLERNYRFKILDSSKKFSTILNFPKAKPIYAEPSEFIQQGKLKIKNGTKETLLDDLYYQVQDKPLPVEEEVVVEKIIKVKNFFEVRTNKGNYYALRILLGIGKTGNSKMLKIPGEDLPKVFNKLFDPADAKGENVLVVGGGDSALETAAAVSEFAASVTLSYRGSVFSRPKEGNIEKLNKIVNEDRINLMLQSEVVRITGNAATLKENSGRIIEIKNSMVFVLIGKELPLEFFKRSGIKMEGAMPFISKLMFAELLLVSCLIYFGKVSLPASYLINKFQADSWSSVFSSFFNLKFLSGFFSLPFKEFIPSLFSSSWLKGFEGLIAYLSFIGAGLLGIFLLFYFFKNIYKYFSSSWNIVKYSYLISAGTLFVVVFFGSRYFGLKLLNESPGFYYTFLYSMTILIFGLRRIHVRPTKYIKIQTWTLILIQIFPLFILPEIIFPLLGKLGALGGKSGFILTQVFPNESYWRSYGFILAWPLNIGNLFDGNITLFWFIFSMIQTFVFIPFIIRYWGKGAYCGWICSCGALAETLGDEYRTKMPHGPGPKKTELAGQWVLLFAFVITLLKLISVTEDFNIPLLNSSISTIAGGGKEIYTLVVDIIFAGVLGFGVYFFLSGRVWCRFFCPLAALMHIYSRFSRYRIFSDKKKCISCNICTKVCHMGIDVMNYANKGIPMNDVECVSCSACIVNCPTQVLSFGLVPETDTENKNYRRNDIKGFNKENWLSGM